MKLHVLVAVISVAALSACKSNPVQFGSPDEEAERIKTAFSVSCDDHGRMILCEDTISIGVKNSEVDHIYINSNQSEDKILKFLDIYGFSAKSIREAESGLKPSVSNFELIKDRNSFGHELYVILKKGDAVIQ